jgi:hypothetical protein
VPLKILLIFLFFGRVISIGLSPPKKKNFFEISPQYWLICKGVGELLPWLNQIEKNFGQTIWDKSVIFK